MCECLISSRTSTHWKETITKLDKIDVFTTCHIDFTRHVTINLTRIVKKCGFR